MVEFQYFIATMEERCEIRRFLMEHFLIEETMNVATGITEEEFSPFADATLDSSLRTPFSVVCRDGSGAIAGVALSAVINRNEETISNPLGAPKRPEIQAISSICEEVHGSIWQLLDANINIVLDLEILSVGLPHQRQGIAGKMLEKRESPPLLQEHQIQGFVCQASSHANQMLLKNRGYQELKEVPFSRYVGTDNKPLIRPQDDTRAVKLFWRPYHPL